MIVRVVRAGGSPGEATQDMPPPKPMAYIAGEVQK